jgi:clan AA aspartic protease (TIGR02281 family)
MSKPSTYVYALISGILLGWLAQQFWSVGSVQTNRARDSLLSQNAARLQHLKNTHRVVVTPAFVTKTPVDKKDELLDLLASGQVELADELFRESWDYFTHDLSFSRAIAEKWLAIGHYESALTLLYDQRLFIPFNQEADLLQLIYELVEVTETKLAQKQQLYAMIGLYRLLLNLHAEHIPYYLSLTYWLIESGDFYSAEQSLAGAMNDARYEEQVDKFTLRIEQGDSEASVITVPLNKIGEHFVVSVIINNTYTMELMIDTGATMSVLKTSFVEENMEDVFFNAESLTMNTANGAVDGKRLTIESFVLGPHELKDVEVGAVPLPNFKYDGLLGMNVLNRFEFFIDQEQQLLILK